MIDHYRNYKHLIWLVSLFFISYFATIILQNRIVAVGHYFICAAVLVYPLSYSIANVITEVYGYKISRQLIFLGLVCWIVIASLIEITIKAPVPAFWQSYDNAYDAVMAPIFRGVILSSFAVIIGQFVNIYILTNLKLRAHGRFFILRNLTSTAIGDFVAVALALLGVFIGRMPVFKIMELSVFEYIFMALYTVATSVPVAVIASYIKKSEGITDYSDNYNPIKDPQHKNNTA